MGISVTDRKKLWGRSGNKCAMCKQKLVEEASELGDDLTIIGVEAHIVSQSPDGPRGDSPLTAAQRDSYSNLILLCRNDHERIDDRPNEYPVGEVQAIKKRHEKAIDASGELDKQLQLREEQWAALIDRLDELMGWQTWDDDTAGIFDPNSNGLSVDVHRRLVQASDWIFNRAWPEDHPRLRGAIQMLGRVLNDFLATFDKHVEARPPDSPKVLRTEQFYKTGGWLPEERYHELARRYDEHVVLVQDLALETTRYGNYVARLVREEIDGSFRFNEGLLVVTVGPFMDDFPQLGYYRARPEFGEADFANGEPYRSLEQFRQDRFRRELRAPADD